jgi:hypothetical protein
MPDLLGAACGLGTMKALSQLPLLLLCLAIPCLLFLSSFLPLWLGVGTRWHLYLDTDEVLLGGQKQPFIQGGGGSGISPAVMGPHRQGPLCKVRSHVGPKRSYLSRILL